MQRHFWAVIFPVGTICTLKRDGEISLEKESLFPSPSPLHGTEEEGGYSSCQLLFITADGKGSQSNTKATAYITRSETCRNSWIIKHSAKSPVQVLSCSVEYSFFFLIEVQLTYNIIVVSDVQHLYSWRYDHHDLLAIWPWVTYLSSLSIAFSLPLWLQKNVQLVQFLNSIVTVVSKTHHCMTQYRVSLCFVGSASGRQIGAQTSCCPIL